MKQLKSFQVCLHRNLCIFRKDISSTLNPQTKCFCYINSIQLRKMKQYLLSKYCISKVKSLEEIRNNIYNWHSSNVYRYILQNTNEKY